MTDVDVVVVGAGAAGAMAALHAAARGRRTLLLEKNQRPGLKILISGGGRCNVTTTRSGADLEAQYGTRRGRFLRHALRSFPPTAVCAFFEASGVPLQQEDLEKLFPVSQRAQDVRDALLRRCRAAGADVVVGTAVQAVGRRGDRFVVALPTGEVRAASVVLATGGLSYAKTGATGDGYAWCRAFGHTVTACWPALAPLCVERPWVRALQGIVLDGTDLAVLDGQGRERLRRRRPILFTHKGLSGPAPMDLAGDVEELQGQAQVRFDFAPGIPREALEAQWLAAAAAHGGRRIEALLPSELPERLRAALVAEAGVDGTLANLAREARRRLLQAVKDLRVPVPKSLGFDHAEVTRGGVELAEVDPRTMQSRLQPGLFVCGELLDVDGPIGGFNFQAAFATGRLAGLSA
ncbi:MAG: aminoacetone oxidase family FAD-binding enzyme [Planctomycetes bacterium]|nr:aminoacetone oxidase family FAD-binding enzyme [Planctomycetota bacterium]